MKIKHLVLSFLAIPAFLLGQDTTNVARLDTLRFHRIIDKHQGAIESIAYSKDGSYFATGSWDRKARVYQVDSLKNYSFLREFKFHHAAITCVDISPDNKYIAIGSKDFTFSVYELATGKMRYVSRDHKNALSQLFFDPSSSFLITASLDGTARVYRVQDFEQANPNSLALSYSAKINGAQLSPGKGKFLLATDDQKVVEVNIKGAVSSAFIGHSARVTCVDVSHNNKLLVSGSDDKTVRIWDYKTKQVLRVLEGHTWFITSVHFSKDDRFVIASCNNGEVKIWDVATGKETAYVPTLGKNARQALFSPDMKTVAVATLQDGPTYGPVLYHTPFEVVKPAPKSVKGKSAGPVKKGAKTPTKSPVKKAK